MNSKKKREGLSFGLTKLPQNCTKKLKLITKKVGPVFQLKRNPKNLEKMLELVFKTSQKKPLKTEAEN